MKVEPNELEKALADKCAALVKAGHDPEQVALAPPSSPITWRAIGVYHRICGEVGDRLKERISASACRRHPAENRDEY